MILSSILECQGQHCQDSMLVVNWQEFTCQSSPTWWEMGLYWAYLSMQKKTHWCTSMYCKIMQILQFFWPLQKWHIFWQHLYVVLFDVLMIWLSFTITSIVISKTPEQQTQTGHRCNPCTAGEVLLRTESTPPGVSWQTFVERLWIHLQKAEHSASRLLWNPISWPSAKLFILPPVYSACLAARQWLECTRSGGISPQVARWRLGKSGFTSVGEVDRNTVWKTHADISQQEA